GYFQSTDGSLRQARIAARKSGGKGLGIAIARATVDSDAPRRIGLAGGGFGGDLTSDSTRTDGYVLSTDLAPSILGRFGFPIPSQVSGQQITSEGSVDPAAIV